jgi:hypothetical protein
MSPARCSAGGDKRNRRTTDTQHHGQRLVRQRKFVALDPIVRHDAASGMQRCSAE